MSTSSVDKLRKRFSLSLRQRTKDTEAFSEMDEQAVYQEESSTPTSASRFLPGKFLKSFFLRFCRELM